MIRAELYIKDNKYTICASQNCQKIKCFLSNNSSEQDSNVESTLLKFGCPTIFMQKILLQPRTKQFLSVLLKSVITDTMQPYF